MVGELKDLQKGIYPAERSYPAVACTHGMARD